MKCLSFIGLVILLTLTLASFSPLNSLESKDDQRVISVWNSFANETRSWIAIRKNTMVVKGRSKMEMESWERVKEKWAVVVLAVEVGKHE